MTVSTFFCSSCDGVHEGPPLSYAAVAPVYWTDAHTSQQGCVLGEEQCVIAGEHFFVRASLALPISDTGGEFDWGVWVSLSPANFARMSEVWERPERVEEPPYFGWLSTELPVYEPTTVNLKTRLHTRPLGERPSVELEPTDHPLAVDQREGITMARVRRLAERLLHTDPQFG
ncbi:DUF2199 domain-containing protein [Nocardia sp. NPDC057668]|uniref:DUF2199 domain-containing protein n=1 Tax=Nocardia sp. NPDC057668 TaxID=3346202 RepID=UPI0036730302